MKLYDFHWINKGCTVEVLYGEHRSFRVQKTFKVVSLDSSDNCTVDVYGELIQFKTSSLKLISKPGYTKLSDGKWKPDYLIY